MEKVPGEDPNGTWDKKDSPIFGTDAEYSACKSS
jgi:hypothetical protein